MNAAHRSLAAGRWFELSFIEQMANVGSEVTRALRWRSQGDRDHMAKALERGLELLDLTVSDARNRHRLRELTRVRELLKDDFYADNRYASTDELWRRYFFAFAYAARRNR
jgi:hypothetical protein